MKGLCLLRNNKSKHSVVICVLAKRLFLEFVLWRYIFHVLDILNILIYKVFGYFLKFNLEYIRQDKIRYYRFTRDYFLQSF